MIAIAKKLLSGAKAKKVLAVRSVQQVNERVRLKVMRGRERSLEEMVEAKRNNFLTKARSPHSPLPRNRESSLKGYEFWFRREIAKRIPHSPYNKDAINAELQPMARVASSADRYNRALYTMHA